METAETRRFIYTQLCRFLCASRPLFLVQFTRWKYAATVQVYGASVCNLYLNVFRPAMRLVRFCGSACLYVWCLNQLGISFNERQFNANRWVKAERELLETHCSRIMSTIFYSYVKWLNSFNLLYCLCARAPARIPHSTQFILIRNFIECS